MDLRKKQNDCENADSTLKGSTPKHRCVNSYSNYTQMKLHNGGNKMNYLQA